MHTLKSVQISLSRSCFSKTSKDSRASTMTLCKIMGRGFLRVHIAPP